MRHKPTIYYLCMVMAVGLLVGCANVQKEMVKPNKQVKEQRAHAVNVDVKKSALKKVLPLPTHARIAYLRKIGEDSSFLSVNDYWPTANDMCHYEGDRVRQSLGGHDDYKYSDTFVVTPGRSRLLSIYLKSKYEKHSSSDHLCVVTYQKNISGGRKGAKVIIKKAMESLQSLGVQTYPSDQ